MERSLSRLFLAVVLFSVTASAQSAPGAEPKPLSESLQGPAREAYASAQILLNNNDPAGALAKYRQAYDLSRDPRLLYNMAICEKNQRAYARTQRLLERYEREAGASILPDDKSLVDDALAAIKSFVGEVNLRVSDEGASVMLDGEPAGTTPLTAPLLVDLGKHKILVGKQNFQTIERTIEIVGGSRTTVAITLVPEVHLSHLIVMTGPEATIAIDGQRVGNGRFDGRLAVGTHEVRVTAPGKIAHHASLDLRDGETRTLELTLVDEVHRAPVWPWIVGGVVVVGGAVGGYFLLRPREQTVPLPRGELADVHFASLIRWR